MTLLNCLKQGVYDIIQVGWKRILPCIPQLIIPVKTALNTRNKTVIVKVLKVLQRLVVCDAEGGVPLIGHSLVPYYRQLLPVLNIFIRQNGDIFESVTRRLSLLLRSLIALWKLPQKISGTALSTGRRTE